MTRLEGGHYVPPPQKKEREREKENKMFILPSQTLSWGILHEKI
jgi:hypothetical protein